jgi:radical SAM superfamily enzyme YgiQ (UPF0313 family)
MVNPNRMRPPIAPIALDYLAESLRWHGYEPCLCDLTFADDWESELENTLESAQPVAVAVTVRNIDDAYFASQDFVLEKTAKMVKAVAIRTPAPVVLGGIGFSLAPKEVLDFTGATYGIHGDGEGALPELLDCIAAGGSAAEVPGIVYRTNDGVISSNPPSHGDVFSMPIASRDFVNNERYFAEGGQVGIETKRGCPGSCVYCVEPPAKGKSSRLRDPEEIADEFTSLLNQGIDVFHLCDSEFNLPPDHAAAVCEALLQRGLEKEIRWYTYAYPQPFDRDLGVAMVKAGCAGINFGVDHVDEALLKGLGRSYGVEEIRQTAQACREAGLTVMFDLLFGGPGETRETLARAVDAMREIAPDRVGLSCGVRIYPHTPLAKMVLKQGPLELNPNLHGTVEDNDDLLRPIYYVDEGIDGDIHAVVSELVREDKRFLHADPHQVDGNYNYNDNSVLANAIRAGERGAYWDILRRLEEGESR